MIEVACLKCRGEGRLVDSSTVSVEVPAGVAQDNYIPLRGLGDAGPNGGPAGDLQVLIEEKPHDLFTRDGADLWVEVPVAMPHAALGGTIEIPTLDGPVTKKIAAGTQTGMDLKIGGAGLPRLRGRGKGDLIARLRVWTPTRLSAREKQLFEELGSLEAGKTPRPGKGFFDKVRDAFGA